MKNKQRYIEFCLFLKEKEAQFPGEQRSTTLGLAARAAPWPLENSALSSGCYDCSVPRAPVSLLGAYRWAGGLVKGNRREREMKAVSLHP